MGPSAHGSSSGRRLGPIMQVAYVVDDMHGAIRHWTTKLSVGPFFLFEHAGFRELTFNGMPTALDVSLAFAYSGDIQIELVQQHNDVPSVFSGFRQSSGSAMHHVGVCSTDIRADEAHLIAAGMRPVQRGVSSRGTETVFLECGPNGPGLLELIQASARVSAFYCEMKRAADHWDGATALAPSPSTS